MKFARISLVALAVLMMFAIVGCGQQGPANRRIAVVFPAGEDDFTREAVRLAENEIESLSKDRTFSYTFMKAASANEQLNYVNAFVSETQSALQPQSNEDKDKKPYGLIVLWPMDAETLRPAVEKARAAGIPVMLCGQSIPGFPPTSSVMVDFDATAQMAVAYIQNHTDARIMLLDTADGSDGEEHYYTPFARALVDAAGDKAALMGVFDPQDKERRASAKSAVEAMIRQDQMQNIQAVFAVDDEIALGVLDAVKANPGCGVKVIAGVGGTKAFVDAMADAPIEMVTYAYSPAMTKTVMRLSADVSVGVSILPEYKIITTQVDKVHLKEYRNSDEYIARYGG